MEHQGLRILFDSKSEKYKTPFGALRTGQKCSFNIFVPESCPAKNVYFILEKDGRKEKCIKMQRGQTSDLYVNFFVEITADKTGLYFYWFYIEKESDGFRLFKEGYSDTNMEWGEKWQLTVFDREYNSPDWSKGAVIYQIFPDRFYKYGECDVTEKLTPFEVHDNLYDIPRSYPDQNGNWNNDFFGGNLQGITEKLNYIKDLGADIIYLNPIVKAFSNHRYDTADYKKVDPMLGTLDDFKKLCDEAHALNIKIVIDGVFSHTGNKSIYYEDALKNENSPYRDWYDFKTFWWGIDTLPQIKKGHQGFIKFISEEIVPFWLNLGADGIRLDVADELTDEFIRQIAKSAKQIKDALIIGEVWEDASNKISYGVRREYLMGNELDSVMNYPFLNAVTGYVKKEKSPQQFSNEIMSIAENYPTEILCSCMNILSTHDTPRVLTVFGGNKSALKTAVFLQFMLPGAPSVYYGDEIGMEGGKDPFNREYFKWNNMDIDLQCFFKKMSGLKHKYPELKYGKIKVENKKDVVVFYRDQLKIVVNVSDNEHYESGEIIFGENTNRNTVKKYGFAIIKEGRY